MKVRHNNQRTQLHNVGATYNIHTIRLRGCAILPIPYKLMTSHLVYSIFDLSRLGAGGTIPKVSHFNKKL